MSKTKTLQLYLIGTALSLLATSTTADSITMTFEQTLDLDTGIVSDVSIVPGEQTGADVVISYNADRAEHAVVFPVGEVVEMAFVAGVLCVDVLSADGTGMIFTSEPIDQVLSTSNCVVVRTDQGALFKLGGVSESGMIVTFDSTTL